MRSACSAQRIGISRASEIETYSNGHEFMRHILTLTQSDSLPNPLKSSTPCHVSTDSIQFVAVFAAYLQPLLYP